MKKWYRKGQLYKRGKRSLALLLSACLIGTMIPVTARAESGNTNTGLCEHHTEHTVECGYVEDSEGSPCTYVCDICKEEAEQGKTNVIPEENLTVQTQEQIAGKSITAWQWVDEEECLDPETGNLALPFANKEHPAYFDDVISFLPTRIQATVENTEDTEAEATNETITLGDWECDNYPEEGAYSGSYTFTAALPEGYALSGEAEALTVLVELGGAQMYENEESNITYRTCDSNGQNWTTATCTSATEVADADTVWGTSSTDTWYVVNDTMDIGSSSSRVRISVSGNVHLILTDGCSLTINGGIEVADGNSLTIYGQTGDTGTLLIKNVETGNAGIGSASGTKCGTITINGGKVTAQGYKGAGIGGGYQREGGVITINGGTVTATGHNAGAGIGSGGDSASASGGTITINGGTVTATGGAVGGAGIGGGASGNGGTITINGGTVTATGYSSGGAGIGGGAGGSGGTISISGGTVTATGGTNGGAGIGGGGRADGEIGGSGGSIDISGGTVTATGGTNGGAGIGDGDGGSGGTVAISDSFVMAGSISDTSSQSEWSGLIFTGEASKVYGDSVNISTDCTIPSGKSLEVAVNQTISIADTKTLTNAGTIYNNGTFTGTVVNDSGIIHSTGTISRVSGGTINQYSIEPTEIIAGTSAALALKVNGSDASVESVAYTLDANEANAELVEETTLKAAKNIGSKIPVTATFTVDTVSMTRTEEITITECDVHSYGDFDGNGFRVCSVCGKDDYQPANVVSATHHPELMDEHANYYAIENAGQLYWFAQQVNTVNTSMNAILTSDITVNSGASAGAVANCNGTKAEGWRDWTPIGNSSNKYVGAFDGNEHTVSGLYLNSNTEYVGLFGYNSGTIQNVGVIDSYLKGTKYVGGICGQNNGTIANSYNTSTISGAAYVGGICGTNGKTITYSYNIGTVNGSQLFGSICGAHYGKISNSYYISQGSINGVGYISASQSDYTRKTSEQFASGEVAYLLNVTNAMEIWGQTLGESGDTYPVFGGIKVYRNETYTGCIENPGNPTYSYSNTEEENAYKSHQYQISTDGMYHECSVGQEKIYHSDVAKFISGDEANTITGTCTECGNLGTVTLIAPTGDLTYNGTAREATVDASNSVLKGAIDIAYNTSDGNAPKDAGTYTASITLGTGDDAATVSVEYTIEQATPTISWGMSSGGNWVELDEIPVAYTGSEIAQDKLVPPTVALVNGETYSGEISYSYRGQGSSDAFTSGLPTEIGTYEVKASIAADGNYKEAARTVKLTVNWLNTPAVAVLTDQKNVTLSGDDWWAQSVTFTAPNSFTISNSLTDSFGTFFEYNEQTGADETEVIYYLKNGNGEIAKKTTTVRIDKTAPDWSGENDGISIKTNKWKSLLSTISFGLFYKETVDVEVRASDSLSGVVAYYYYVDSTDGTVKTAAELDALNFTEYTEGVSGQNPSVIVTSLAPDGNYIVYAYAVDAAGNRSAYVCSDGVVVDKTAPAISDIIAPSKEASTLTDTTAQISFTGSEAGTYFYVVKKISETAPTTITDFATEQANDGYSSWTANDDVSFASMTSDTNNKITLNGLNANTEYILYLAAVDSAGNSSIVYSQSFTTSKIKPTIVKNPIISGTYGDAVSSMTLTDGVTKVGDTEIGGTWTLTDTNVSDVPGVETTTTYQVTFTPTDSLYESVIVQVTPTVSPKSITVTADNKTKTYGKDNPDLTFTVPSGVLVGTDTKDSLGVTLECEATKTSPVNADGYTIKGNSSSANYVVTIIPGTLTIERANAEINVGTTTYNKTFGNEDFTLDVTDNNTEANVQYEVATGTDVITVSNGTVTILKAGTATITVSLPASTNYNAATDKTITVTVAKKSGYTVDDINKSYIYSGGNSENIDLSTCLPANCGNVTYGTPQVNGALYTDDGQPTVSNNGELSYRVKAGSVGTAGTIKITVTTENYEDFTITVKVELIDKIPVSLKDDSSVTLQNSILTYGQALSTLTFNSAVFVDGGGNVVTGTLAWKTPDATPNAGTTSATWVFTPNDESYATVEDTVAITVNKATPVVTAAPTVAERTYHPTESLTDADLIGGTVNVSGSWSWQTAGIIPTVNNSGYVAVFTPTDNTNYETVTKTITVTVSKGTPYIVTAPTAAAITYGATLGDSTISGGTVQYSDSDATAVSGSFAWADATTKPTVADSGTTAYRVVFNPSDTENYNTAETDITLTVNKADNAPSMPSATMNVAYSCKKVSDVTLPTGWVWQDADKDTALAVDTPVTATAVYNGADKGNFVNETVSVTITRSACDHANTEVRNAKEATCKETGYTGDTYCTDCGALLTTGTTIPLADHQGGTATCTKKAVCTVCGKEYGTLDANNHVHTEIKGAVAATCTAGGYTGDTYCTDCGVKTKTGTVTSALGHNYTGKVTTEPTTEKEGVRTYTCDRCGHSYTESIPKLPEQSHAHFHIGTVSKAATCIENGVIIYSCSCGDSYTETIPALGHHYVSRVTKQPTTGSEGVMTYTCDRCGHSFIRAIAKLQNTNPNKPASNKPASSNTANSNPEDNNSGDNNPGDNNPEDNKPAEDNAPDTRTPYIKDENGKEGWDVIKDEVDKTKDGDTVTVEMNGTSVVPGDVLDDIKGKDVTIVFDMGGGITWSVNGKSITAESVSDIDFTVKADTNTIPVNIINNVTGERYSKQISLSYDGEFGFTAVLSINMDAGNAGLYANLFYYNEKTGEMEFICYDEIAEDGTAELTFTHASDYAIVIDTEPMGESAQVDNPASESQDTETETTQTDAEASNAAWNPWWIIIIGIVVIVIGLGVFLVVKKKTKDEE